MELDQTDLKILRALEKDARIKLTDLSKKTGMSENGLKYRIARMEDRGVIEGYEVNVNPGSVNMDTPAFFRIKIKQINGTSEDAIIETFRSLEKIYRVTGEYDYIALGHFRDHEDLYEFVNRGLVNNEYVRDYSVEIALNTIKDGNFRL